MSALRFALAVAFSRDRRQRWRQISLIVGGGICLWALLLSLGLLGAVATATTHSDARQPTIVMPAYTGDLKHDDALGPPDGATVRIVQRATVIDGAQVSTVWIEPLPGHENDPSTIPPGLRSLPAPGTAVLSPGLVNAGHSARELGWKPSRVGTGPGGAIGQDGLLTASERIIYVRPAAGRDLGIGTTPSYAKGFGAPGYTPDYEDDGGTVVDGFADMFEQDPELLSTSMTVQVALWALILPGLVLLVSASRTRSALRDRRLALMVTLGIRERVARTVLAFETALLAGAGATVGALLHAAISGHLAHIPATSITLLPGSLTVPWWSYPAAVAAIACIASICGAMGRLHRPQARRQRRRPRAIGAVLFATALSAVALSAAISGPLRGAVGSQFLISRGLFGVGFLGSLVSLPLALPFLTWLVAGVLMRSSRPAIWATARRLRGDATRLSRLGAVIGLLVLTVSVATALWAASLSDQHDEASPGWSDRSIGVSWRSPHPQDLEHARAALADNRIDALVLPTHEEDDSKGPVPDTLVIEDSPTTVTFLGGDAQHLCSDPAALTAFLNQRTGSGAAPAGTTETTGTSMSVLVIPRTHVASPALQHALADLPGLNIDPPSSEITAPRPVQQWIFASALSALLILTIAAIREIGDRHLDDAERDAVHLRLGLSSAAVDLLGWTTLLIPLIVGLVTAGIAANLIAYGGQILNVTHPEPLKFLVITLITLLAAALVLAVSGIARRAGRRTG